VSEPAGDADSGNAAIARRFRAPARINIIGEHTDYNDGFVLPMATALYTTVTATTRHDRLVRATTDHPGHTGRFSLDDAASPARGQWLDYVRGVAIELEAAGATLGGADFVIESDIPIGAGLSSSAALELAVGNAFLSIADQSVEPDKLSRICQSAEQKHVGVQCGIMDQFTVACAKPGHALLLDCRSLDTEHIPVPPEFGLLVVDSGARHRHPEGGYNDRAAECAAAVQILAASNPAIESLRDADLEMLEGLGTRLGDVLYRRCRHVLSENDRVLRAVDALRNNALAELGELLNEGHRSLRDDFEVSCAEVDSLVSLVKGIRGVAGSRMMGGGFGGCILVLAASGDMPAVSASIHDRYVAAFQREPWLHHVSPASPAGEAPLQ
jgi:galactokinase